ncbi:MAG: hypothetical protein JKY19_07200 [Alcanivoracaceae bacterium]|nr:hypothetical protein [Alcanivoracaceae bacterium]
MKPYPYDKFKIRLPYDCKEAIRRILDNTEPTSFAQSQSKTKIFLGQVNACSFKIQKSIRYQNSFLPIAQGKISNDGFYCVVTVTLRLSISTIVFMLIWFGYFIKMIIEYYVVTSEIQLLPASFLLFGYVLVMSGFWFDAPRTEQAIKDVFKLVPE